MTNPTVFTYRFLSYGIAYPNQAFLPTLQECLLKTGKAKSILSPIVDSLSKEKLVNLQAEYTRLFISGYPKTPCPPYESAYREGQLMGNSNASVRTLYNEWGMAVQPSMGDHLATELEFMAFLTTVALTTPEMAEPALTARSTFQRDHLDKWIPRFIVDLKKHTQIEGYQMLADCMVGLNSFVETA